MDADGKTEICVAAKPLPKFCNTVEVAAFFSNIGTNQCLQRAGRSIRVDAVIFGLRCIIFQDLSQKTRLGNQRREALFCT